MKRIATYRDFLGELTVIYRRTSFPTVKIKSSQDAADFLRPYYDEIMDNHEEFKILHLNNNNNVANVHHVSKGGLTGTIVDTRLVVREALLINCVAVIISHCHPSGNLKFSNADKKVTQQLIRAFEYFDIKLLDHIVITREGYISMADEGEL